MIPNSFSLGPLTVHMYGLIIALAVTLGWRLAKKRAAIYKIPENIFDDFIIITPLIFGIIGARTYHIIDKWSYYSQYPQEIILVNNGGLGVWGGIAGMILGIWFIAKIKKINPLSFLDLLSPSIILGQAIGRIGNFINQEGFGPPTNLPWGVYIDPAHRPQQFMFSTHFHPTFFYEAVLNLVAFFILLKLSAKIAKPGQIFALYLILYSLIRLLVEFWRIDTARIGDLQTAHLISIAGLVIGLYFLSRIPKKQS